MGGEGPGALMVLRADERVCMRGWSVGDSWGAVGGWEVLGWEEAEVDWGGGRGVVFFLRERSGELGNVQRGRVLKF